MGEVNVQLVREFFELNAFSVTMNWHQLPTGNRPADSGLQLFVENRAWQPRGRLDPVLQGADIIGLERALVEVRAWHSDRFYPSVVESNPVLTHVARDESQAMARDYFQHQPFATVLVISELPANIEHRQRAIEPLVAAGIDHLLEFPTVLRDLLDRIDPANEYEGSDTLQVLRLLKRYRLVRNQQMEFVFPRDPGAMGLARLPETIPPDEDETN